MPYVKRGQLWSHLIRAVLVALAALALLVLVVLAFLRLVWSD